MYRFSLILVCGFLFFNSSFSQSPVTVKSPDENVTATVSFEDGIPRYSIFFQNNKAIEPSTFDFQLHDEKPLAGPFKVLDVKKSKKYETWHPVYGATSLIKNEYRQAVIVLQEKNSLKRRIQFIIRAFNDGVAFRYLVPEQQNVKEINILSENTRFNFAKNYKCFALKRRSFGDSYEGPYDPVKLSDVKKKDVIGPPLLIDAENFWMAITEADLEHYAGLSLQRGEHDGQMVSSLAPLPNSKLKVKAQSPLETPWRVILLGLQAGDLIESNMILNLNEPSEIQDVSWIKPGKAIWPWWNGRITSDPDIPNGGPSTAALKYYTDFAAKHDLPYLVVDAGWYSMEMDAWNQPEKEDVLTMEETRKDFYDIQEVVSYADEKGVDTFIWVHLASLKYKIEEALSAYAKWGAEGIKLDNYGGEDQELVELFHKVIQLSAKYNLMVDYHGAYKPTGYTRTWPNFMTSEGVMGLENSRGTKTRITPQHNATIPFTRMLAGAMDYTPGAFDLDGTEKHPKSVVTTRAQQMAMFVVYYSPIQMLVDYPAAYEDAPQQFNFLKKVPTTWDETKFIDGYPGDYIILARRSGEEWYVGLMSDEEKRRVDVPLDFLDAGHSYQAHIYKDGSNIENNRQDVEYAKQKVTAETVLTAELASGGGQALRIVPEK